MAFDGNGRFLVIDVSPFMRSVLFSTGGPGGLSTLFTLPAGVIPTGIAIDNANRIFTAADDGHIRIHDANGNLVNGAFATGLGSYPVLQFGKGGAFGMELYVIDTSGNLLRFDTLGNATLLGSGFVDVKDLAFGLDRALYVSEQSNNRILRVAQNLPAQVTLTPSADVNPVGVSHTVTATVTATAGQPVEDVTAQFQVQGSVSAEGSCTTDENGQCDFTYAGPQLPGADAITAYADTNNNGVRDVPVEPEAAATKAWVLPTSTPGHVTGGGHILAPDFDEIAFGFNARSTDRGFSGNCNVVDLSTEPKTHIKCLDVTTLVQTPAVGGGGTATFFGNASINGVTTTYRIDVADVAEPGAGRDTFSILTTSGYTAGGLLTKGNIQVHR
jgi:hypothetical protein